MQSHQLKIASLPKFSRPFDIQKPDDASHPVSFFAVRAGFEPAVRLPVRQFSKLVVSATHPSHQADPISYRDCKYRTILMISKINL